MWELDCEAKGFQVDAAERKGRALPKWYVEGPDLLGRDDWYLAAFHRLSTCRPLGFGPGPIPWRDIHRYALHAGLDRSATESFTTVIMTMDAAWLRWQEENRSDAKD